MVVLNRNMNSPFSRVLAHSVRRRDLIAHRFRARSDSNISRRNPRVSEAKEPSFDEAKQARTTLFLSFPSDHAFQFPSLVDREVLVELFPERFVVPSSSSSSNSSLLVLPFPFLLIVQNFLRLELVLVRVGVPFARRSRPTLDVVLAIVLDSFSVRPFRD